MPDLTSLLSALRSPKVSLAIFLFSGALLFAPFERTGLSRPSFTSEYESLFVVVFFLSGALLAVEILSWIWRQARRPYYAWRRRQQAEDAFLSLNLNELCVLWAMTQMGTRTIKGSSTNDLMLSLREKGCLHLMSGLQSANQLHHAMPNEIYEIVRRRGFDRMPDDFKNSASFHDKVREIVQVATDPWA